MEEKPDNLVKIIPKVDIAILKETCTRMGIANKKKKILYPSCYVYRNFEDFFIVHFKELFTLTRVGGYNNISQKDIERKNSIISYLKNWNMLDVDETCIEPHNEPIFVLPYKEKREWTISHKFNIVNAEVID